MNDKCLNGEDVCLKDVFLWMVELMFFDEEVIFGAVYSGITVEVDVAVMVMDFQSVCRMCVVGDLFVSEVTSVWNCVILVVFTGECTVVMVVLDDDWDDKWMTLEEMVFMVVFFCPWLLDFGGLFIDSSIMESNPSFPKISSSDSPALKEIISSLRISSRSSLFI